MTDILFHSILSNLLISSAVALIAWTVQRSGRSPVIANVLWTIVLLKMITPPIWTIQLIPVESIQTVAQSDISNQTLEDKENLFLHSDDHHAVAEPVDEQDESLSPEHQNANVPLVDIGAAEATSSGWLGYLFRIATTTWVIGSLTIALLTLYRLLQFNRHLKNFAKPAAPEVSKLVDETAQRFGLARTPRVVVTSANVSPFCWWIGGQTRIVLSASSVEELSQDELKMVVAHEVAHLKRKDHWIRLLECLVTAILWWNPVMWWSRKQLRITEEMACDALVLEKMNTSGHVYASSLLRMTELLSSSAIRPPTWASAMTSGGKLEKRLKMIINNQRPIVSKRSFALFSLIAVCIFPLGLVYGQDVEAVKKRLAESVKAGEITKSQAGFMLEALELSMKMKSQSQSKNQGYNRVYDEKARESAEMGRRKEKYARALEEYDRAISRGKLSRKEAEEMAIELRQDLFGDISKARADRNKANQEMVKRELAAKEKEYAKYIQDISAAVKKGDISKKDAERKIIAVQKEMSEAKKVVEGHFKAKSFADNKKNEFYKRDNELAEKKEQFNQLYRDIEKAVKQGNNSKEDAQKKLSAMQNKFFAESEKKNAESYKKREAQYVEIQKQRALLEKELAVREQKFAAAVREILSAVENGKVSRKDADLKISEMKNQIFGTKKAMKAESEKRAKELEALESRYQRNAIEFKKAIEAEKVARDEALKKAMEMQKKLNDERNRELRRYKEQAAKKDMASREMALERAAIEIDAAIKSGKIKRADGLQKLEAIKREYGVYRKRYEQDLKLQQQKELENQKRMLEAEVKELKKLLEETRRATGKTDADKTRLGVELLQGQLIVEGYELKQGEKVNGKKK